MKAFILYRPNSEFARIVEEYVHDFKRLMGRDIELVDLNTRDGAATASLYDVMEHPSLMVVRDDGQVLQEWQGTHLPLMNELSGYLSS
jgi:hypothetical protein